jgi:hypothetical protein
VGGDLIEEVVAAADGLAELGLEARQVGADLRKCQQGGGVHQEER